MLLGMGAGPAHGIAVESLPDINVSQGGVYRGTAPARSRDLMLDDKPVRVAADGRYIIGFGRDAPASATLTWRMPTGDIATQNVIVAPRQWQIQSLPTLPRRPVPDAEFEARRPGEIAKIAAARAPNDIASDGWAGRFTPPAIGPTTGVYGSQRILSGTPSAPHAGLDIGAKAGSVVTSPADGVVRLAEGPFTLEGNLVMIDHGMGLVSAFLHLSRIDVRLGDTVKMGQPIGLVGATGRTTGPHLHWGVNWMDVRIDPASLLAAPVK